MDCIIIYWSRYGHGKKIVDHLSNKLDGMGFKTKVFKTDELEPNELPEGDIYVFSSPTEAFRIQKNMRSFIKKMDKMKGKKYGIINTHRMNRNWLKSMARMLSKKNMKKIAEIDFKIGDEVETGNALPEGWKTELDEFADKLVKA